MGFFDELDNQMKQREQSQSSSDSGCMGVVYVLSGIFVSWLLWSQVCAGEGEWYTIVGAIIFSIITLVLFYKTVFKNLLK